jgi:hypothetical protein
MGDVVINQLIDKTSRDVKPEKMEILVDPA